MNMDDSEPGTDVESDHQGQPSNPDSNLQALRNNYEARLLQANLRTEAVRAGMIDLDCLKLIDPATVRTDEAGNIVEGKALMASLQRKKPWLFGSMSSSNTTPPPTSAPIRQRMAIDMSDEEYAAARAALTRHSY